MATTAYLATVQDIQEKSAWLICHESGCWLWMGPRNEKGYGRLTHLSVTNGAHRWFYELLVSVIPDDLEIDHLCRVRNCVNPKHLEAVTHTENNNRRPDIKRSTCKRGHPMHAIKIRGKNKNICPACKRAGTYAGRYNTSVEIELEKMKSRNDPLLSLPTFTHFNSRNRDNAPLGVTT